MVYETAAHGKSCVGRTQATSGVRNAAVAGVQSITQGGRAHRSLLAR